MQAVRSLYRRFVSPWVPSVTSHVASYANLTDQARDAIAQADIVVLQVQDFVARIGALDLPPTAQRLMAPVLAGNFLWPFGGRARPGNKPSPGLPEGPFSAQLGDSYLNRLIQRGADPAEAAADYRALDVAANTDLDRLFEIVIAKQARLDGELGYDAAGIIKAHFRTERLFRTLFHPSVRLMNHLARTLFEQMGIDPAIAGRVERLQKQVLQPPAECPVHPSVARHFGMTCIDATTRFQFLNEDACTFDEWVRRYVTQSWNQPLAAGVSLAEREDETERALALLDEGLPRCPGSAAGWRARALVLERLGRRDDAIEAIRRAIAVDPLVPHFHLVLGHLLSRTGESAAAQDEYTAAMELDPASAESQRMVVQHRARLGDLAGAAQAGEAMLADPVEPPTPALLTQLSEICARLGRTDAAQRHAARAKTLAEPDNPDAHLALAGLLDAADRPEEAVAALRDAERVAGPDMRLRIARIHGTAGRREEAVAVLLRVVASDPGRADIYAHTAHLLASHDRIEDAEAACRAALVLKRVDDATQLFHSHLLLRLGRPDDAIRAAEAAIRLNPAKASYHGHIGQVFASRGQHDLAAVSFRNAIGFDARQPGFHHGLALALQRQGKAADAADVVRQALAAWPDNHMLLALEHDHAERNRGSV